MPNDEFEVLLERCRENLSEINLRIPTLESSAPRQAVYSLTSPPAAPPVLPPPPPPPPPVAAAPPEPVSRREPDPVPEIKPKPAVVEEREEQEIFPPLHARQRTPPPSVPLWSVPPPSVSVPAPEPESVMPGRRAATATAAAFAVAIGTFGVWLARRPAPDLDLEVGAADAMALRPEKGDILVAEGKELVDLDRKGRTLERRPLEDAPVESLRWEQGSLWSTDGRTASVIERADGGRTTTFRLNHIPSSIFVKENYIWTSEKGGQVLHEFLISRSILGALLQPLDSFDLNGLSPETFTFDDAGALWLVDEPTRRLYRLRLENGSYKRTASAPLSPFVGPQGELRSLSVEGGTVWILSQASGGRSSLRRIAVSRFDWTP
jgi:hypothetical protein